MATVKMIAPTAQKPQVLRVAAYCRVSSDSADQLHSYAAQIRAYTDLIRQHDGWELVDIYADEGLTGTRMDKREEFGRLMADCRKGKIDKVLVKSISRFARNTKDCLTSLRELKSLGVSVRFEQENIDTETLTTELMVSVSGSLAQQESVSISENMRMSYQRRMQRGEFITCKAPFGYRLVDGKRLEIIPEEAEVVRWMFDAYLSGKSSYQISYVLTEKKILTPTGQITWDCRSVRSILKNEKYVGDTLCQKYYTTESMPFRIKKNRGELAQYYVEHSHPAIIQREKFEKVQILRKYRAQHVSSTYGEYILSLKIVCGKCGTPFARRKTSRGTTWECRKHREKAENCSNGRILETEIYGAFIRMYQCLKQNRKFIFQPALTQFNQLTAMFQKRNPKLIRLNEAMIQVAEQSHKIAKLQTAGLLDADFCAAKQTIYGAELNQMRRERENLLKSGDITFRVEQIRAIFQTIANGPGRLEAFDENLFLELIDKIIVESQTEICFQMHGGIRIIEYIRR